MNALLALEALHDSRHECVLYTTTEPCPLCTGAIRQYGVPEVHYASRDPAGGSIALLNATSFMRRRPVKVVGPPIPELEIVIMAMFTEFSLRARQMSLTWWLFESWEAVVPQGVRLGRALAESEALRRLSETAAPASTVINYIQRFANQSSPR